LVEGVQGSAQPDAFGAESPPYASNRRVSLLRVLHVQRFDVTKRLVQCGGILCWVQFQFVAARIGPYIVAFFRIAANLDVSEVSHMEAGAEISVLVNPSHVNLLVRYFGRAVSRFSSYFIG